MSRPKISTTILRWFIGFLLLVPFQSSIAQDNQFREEVRAKLDSLHESMGFPGATLAFVLDGGSTYEFAAGMADLEANIKMRPSDRMFTGSQGKTFVSAIALQLVDEGRLKLDEPVRSYFGKEDWYIRLANHADITVRHLMNHTGGLPRYVFKELFWEEVLSNPDRVWKPEALLAYILDDPPVHPTGEGWAYSDTDYIVLGMIIEKICNNSYYNELEKRILKPHKLKNTIPSDSRVLPGLIPGYTGDNTPPFNLPGKPLVNGKYAINPQFEWTGGGLISTSLDLARWAKIVYEGNVFSKQMLEEMLKPVDFRTGQPASAGYGLGVFVFDTEHGFIYGHSGIFPGYQTDMLYITSIQCGMAIQINADQFSGKLRKSPGAILSEFIPVIEKYSMMTNRK